MLHWMAEPIRRLQMQQGSSQRSCWIALMFAMGSIRSTFSTVTSGVHCMHATWHHTSGMVVGFSAPPSTGQRQHWGGGCWL